MLTNSGEDTDKSFVHSRRIAMVGLLVSGFALLVSIVLFEGREWSWIRANAGDAVVVWPVYAVVAMVLPRMPPWRVALGVLICAWAVEFSQLYHAPMIDRFRDTFVGRMTIGSTFGVPDLFCYVIGVALAFRFDTSIASRSDRLTRR